MMQASEENESARLHAETQVWQNVTVSQCTPTEEEPYSHLDDRLKVGI